MSNESHYFTYVNYLKISSFLEKYCKKIHISGILFNSLCCQGAEF